MISPSLLHLIIVRLDTLHHHATGMVKLLLIFSFYKHLYPNSDFATPLCREG